MYLTQRRVKAFPYHSPIQAQGHFSLGKNSLTHQINIHCVSTVNQALYQILVEFLRIGVITNLYLPVRISELSLNNSSVISMELNIGEAKRFLNKDRNYPRRVID